MQKRQASQLRYKNKKESIQTLKREGYTNRQIAEMENVSEKTVARALIINTENLCVDGSRTRKSRTVLEQYRNEIQDMIEQGFKPTQIQRKLQSKYPGQTFKRTTISGYCIRLGDELYDSIEQSTGINPELPETSKLYSYKNEINKRLREQCHISKIFEAIKSDGYTGSYSLLQQYCHPLKPVTCKAKKTTRSISRKYIGKAIWKRASLPKDGDSAIIDSNDENKDIEFIKSKFPEFSQLENIIKEFRVSYANKDIDAIKRWVITYSECGFQSIISFINGIKKDETAFYNSMKYEFNNGLLEGFVNKLKEVKRSMFGRASYALLRAKMLLLNKSTLVD